jgi:N-acetylmuramoyl-L-alanine amidase
MGTGARAAARTASIAAVVALGLLAHARAEPIAAPQAAACEKERFKIALDVGHTLEAQGATSARGVKEYVFNLRLAKDIEKALRDTGFAQVHLIVARGYTRAQLFKRVERATALDADVFVSIHHNDVQRRFKSKWEHEGKTYAYSDLYSGHSLFISRENVRFDDSLAFGRLLGAELNARGLTYTHHHTEDVPGERRELLDPEVGVYRYDQLVVLAHANAPAVLLEAGIIVNRTEELLLQTPEHRAKIADATLAATTRFCGLQQSRPPRAGRKAP